MKGVLFLELLPLLERGFLSCSLVITGLNWGQLEILEKTQDRKTDRNLGSGALYTWLETHNPHCFSVLIL
jgi:hypothetical protein